MKLLVATDFPPDAPGGGPAVVRQMLRRFPGEIHWWSVRRAALSPHRSALQNGETQIPLAGHNSFSPGILFPQRRYPRLKAWLMESLWSPLATLSLCKTAMLLKPDQCWLIPHDWSILPLHGLLKVSARLPARIHTTIQDFPDIHLHEESWGHRLVQTLVRYQEEIYRKSASRDATSVPMLEELRARTGCTGGQMLHAGLEQEDFTFLTRPAAPRLASSPIRIAYAGTILAEEEFVLMVQALQKLRVSQPTGVSLEIWSSHSYRSRSWFDSLWMKEHGHASEEKLRTALRDCHWGFVPMNLSDRDPRYYRFSFPTKFITYLAAGLPILALGHPACSVMQTLHGFRAGLSLPGADRLENPASLAELLNPKAREIYRPELLRCAREFFDAEKMRTHLWQSLSGQAL